jgi:hypothetical protein
VTGAPSNALPLAGPCGIGSDGSAGTCAAAGAASSAAAAAQATAMLPARLITPD